MLKVLLMAEEFGAGPSSRIAKISEAIASQMDVYKDIQLDLVENLFTKSIQNLELITNIRSRSEFSEQTLYLFDEYDLVIIALDWQFANLATKSKAQIHFVDGLTWFWDGIDPLISEFAGYWAVNFVGVNEILDKIKTINPNSHLVSPFMEELDTMTPRQNRVISFGGVVNPVFESRTGSIFAKTILNIVHQGGCFDYVLGSKSLDNRINPVNTSQIGSIMNSASIFVGTAGLGHICDSIYYQIPTLFLPPCNDSQYRQTQLLPNTDRNWDYIQWDDLGRDYDVDWDQPQKEILLQIEINIQKLENDHLAKLNLTDCLLNFLLVNLNYQPPSYSFLAKEWGYNGQDQIVRGIFH
ncbi:MAG: hypothetical protein ACRCXZ_01960 [Patescibacteria group bacterium]